jgi:putative protease
MNNKKIELLAPAGSFDSMKAAIHAGADAVYIGGSMFGARAYANNLEEDSLLEAIDYAHLHGRSLYLTVNTLLKNSELNSKLYDYLKAYYEQGLDAVIVQDIGVFDFIKTNFPELPIHASTQMTICGVEGAKMLKDLGASRVVTARELSLNEIKAIHDNVEVEIESFVHGALCYCYSGQCLLSSFIGGRSGNRGRCAQPCRLPYKVMKNNKQMNQFNETYVLSPKDMCTIDIIPDMIESGIYSFKIEGRMKKPEYTAGVVRIYRKYIDMYLENGRKGYKVLNSDKKELEDIFNRCGFNQGYYKEHNGRNMITLSEPVKRTRNEALHKELTEYINNEPKEKIKGCLTLTKGSPAKLEILLGDIVVEATGNVVEAAMKQPMDIERIRKQINKTGNTPYEFESIDIDMEDNIFIPIQSINELRRNALEDLQIKLLSVYKREKLSNPSVNSISKTKSEVKCENTINVYIEQESYLYKLLNFEEITSIYLDANMIDKPIKTYIDLCHKANKKCFLVMPHIFRNTPLTTFNKYQTLLENNLDGIVVKNYEEFEYLKGLDYNKEIIIDHNVYTFNGISREFWQSNHIAYDTAPLELNYRELADRGVNESELIVYGYLPMMVSAQCIHKTIEGCNKSSTELFIKDRMNKQFLVRNNCKYCYNTIYNCQPLVLLDNVKEINILAPRSLRLNFTIEDASDIAAIVQKYIDCFIYHKPVQNTICDFTRGHFKRGIE